MNKACADIMRARIAGAVGEAAAFGGVAHNGLKGYLRETVLRQLISPLLPGYVCASAGEITSSQGARSRQCDIIVFDRQLIPPLLVADAGIFPIEAVLACVEVKSCLDRGELQKADEAAESVRRLKMAPGFYDANGNPVQHHVLRPVTALFAFGSDLKSNEFDRYKDVCAEREPAVQLLCVVGKGCWIRSDNGWVQWVGDEPHDETIGFLASLLNSLPVVSATRGRPRLGMYLTDREVAPPSAG